MTALTHRYKAWLLIEAETPLAIGSGRESLTIDRLIARNAAGLPYIPGTGLAGALRAALSDLLSPAEIEKLFGFAKGTAGQGSRLVVNSALKRNCGSLCGRQQGSRLVVNSAHLLGADGAQVLEGLKAIAKEEPYYQNLNTLPQRDHVRINDRGAAADKGKFDEQVCYKGVRFAGSLELLGTAADAAHWQRILEAFAAPFFRIGGGTRRGFGKLKVAKLQTKVYNLKEAQDRNTYLKDDNTLIAPTHAKDVSPNIPQSAKYRHYVLSLSAQDFFFFGAGYGDDEADNVYKTEKVVDWSTGRAQLSEEKILVPASSVKGALRHRVAFHYNRETGCCLNESEGAEQRLLTQKQEELEAFATLPAGIASDSPLWEEAFQKLEEATFEPAAATTRGEADDTSKNKAVRALFGYAANDTAGGGEKGQRGNVLLTDCFLKGAQEKVFDHVRIDRFTGGASDGALFAEKTVFTQQSILLEFFVAQAALQDAAVETAWHATLSDLCEGRLPLGGKTTKGHGSFKGSYTINPKKEPS